MWVEYVKAQSRKGAARVSEYVEGMKAADMPPMEMGVNKGLT